MNRKFTQEGKRIVLILAIVALATSSYSQNYARLSSALFAQAFSNDHHLNVSGKTDARRSSEVTIVPSENNSKQIINEPSTSCCTDQLQAPGVLHANIFRGQATVSLKDLLCNNALTVTDMAGAILMNTSPVNGRDITFDVSRLQPGPYILKITTPDGRISQNRLVITN